MRQLLVDTGVVGVVLASMLGIMGVRGWFYRGGHRRQAAARAELAAATPGPLALDVGSMNLADEPTDVWPQEWDDAGWDEITLASLHDEGGWPEYSVGLVPAQPQGSRGTVSGTAELMAAPARDDPPARSEPSGAPGGRGASGPHADWGAHFHGACQSDCPWCELDDMELVPADAVPGLQRGDGGQDTGYGRNTARAVPGHPAPLAGSWGVNWDAIELAADVRVFMRFQNQDVDRFCDQMAAKFAELVHA